MNAKKNRNQTANKKIRSIQDEDEDERNQTTCRKISEDKDDQFKDFIIQ